VANFGAKGLGDWDFLHAGSAGNHTTTAHSVAAPAARSQRGRRLMIRMLWSERGWRG